MADVNVTFGAKDTGLQAAIGKVNKSIDGLKAGFVGVTAGIAAVAGAFATLRSSLQSVREFADFGGRISDIQAQTELATSEVLILSQAFENAGLSSEKMTASIARLRRQIVEAKEGSKTAVDAFAKLNINVEEIAELPADQQIQKVGAAIAALGSETEKTAVAMDLFGRSGDELLVLFKDSSAIDTARKQVGDLAENLGATVQELDALSDAITAAEKNKGFQFLAGFAKGFKGDIQDATEAINTLDLSGLGEDIGTIALGARSFAADIEKAKGIIDALKAIEQKANPFAGASRAIQSGLNFLRVRGEDAKPDTNTPLDDMAQKPAEAILDTEDSALSLNDTFQSSLSLLTDQSEILFSNLSLTESIDSSLGSQAEQMSSMIELQDRLAESKQKEVEAAEEAAEANKSQLQSTLALAQAQLAGARERLSTIANADVPGIGNRAKRKKDARKALQLEEQAAEAEAFGDTDKAKKLRERASKLRETALGGKDEVKTLEGKVANIETILGTLAQRLPTPALTP